MPRQRASKPPRVGSRKRKASKALSMSLPRPVPKLVLGPPKPPRYMPETPAPSRNWPDSWSSSPLSPSSPPPPPARGQISQDFDVEESNVDDPFLPTNRSAKPSLKLARSTSKPEVSKARGKSQSQGQASEFTALEPHAYFINLEVFFDTEPLHAEVLHRMNGGDNESDIDFDIISYDQQRRARQHSSSKGFSCHLISITAIVVWAFIKKSEEFITTLRDSLSAWNNVALTLRSKFVTKKRDLGVRLTYIYGRQQHVITAADAVAEVIKKPVTQTTKLIKEMKERTLLRGEVEQRIAALMSSILCIDARCKNKGNQCYAIERDQHLQLNSTQVACWSAAIDRNDGLATVDCPPKNIIEVAQAAHQRAKKKASSTAKAENIFTSISSSFDASAISALSQAPHRPTSFTGNALELYFTRQLMKDDKNERREQEARKDKLRAKGKLENRKRIGVQKKRLEKSPHRQNSPRQFTAVDHSSPVEGDDLEEYISWHIKQKPSKEEHFRKAQFELDARAYDLQTIQGWKTVDEAHWTRLDILPGIGIQLARDVSKYAQWRKERLRVRSISRPMFAASAVPSASEVSASEALVQLLSQQQVPEVRYEGNEADEADEEGEEGEEDEYPSGAFDLEYDSDDLAELSDTQ